jgi:WD40 repeat protein
MGKTTCLIVVLFAGIAWPAANAQHQATKAAVDRHGDPLPDGAVARLGTLRWRQNYLSQVAFCPDGKSLLAGGSDLRRWQVASGKVVRHYGPAVAAPFALSADGKFLASRDYVREADNGKILFELKGRAGAVLDVFAFSPKRDILAAGIRQGMIFLCNMSDGKLLRKFRAQRSEVSCLTFSPDGKWLATGAARIGKVQLWSVADAKPVRVLTGHTGWVWSVAFSPDGKFLASVDSTTLKIWDPETGKVLHSRPGPQMEIRCVVFSPDSQLLATSGWEFWDRTILLWDVVSGKFIRRLLGHQDGVLSVAFSPDGKTLASVSRDNTIRLWDTNSGKQLEPTLGHQAPIEAIAISPNNKWIARRARDQSIYLWDPATGKRVRSMERWQVGPVPTNRFTISGLAFSFDSKKLWSASEAVRLWGLTTGRELRAFNANGSPFSALSMTHDGRILASGTRNGRILLWTTTDKGIQATELDTPDNSLYPIHSLAISADGKILVSASDRKLQLWDPASGKELRELGRYDWPIATVALSPDGHALAACSHAIVELWEPTTGSKRWRFQARQDILSLAFSPDGRTIALGGDDAIVWFVDVATGKVIFHRPGHRAKISALAFAPDGKTLVSGSWDTTALIWDTADLTRNRLKAVKVTPKHLEELWSTLARDDAAKAHQALWTMIAGAEKTVPFLRKRLEKIPSVITPELAKLFADLDSRDFKTREKAAAELTNMGKKAEPAMRQTLTMKIPLEVQIRLDRLLKKIAGPFPPLTSEQIRVVRALEVLEQIGSPQASQVVQMVADHAPETILREHARAALERMKRARSD